MCYYFFILTIHGNILGSPALVLDRGETATISSYFPFKSISLLRGARMSFSVPQIDVQESIFIDCSSTMQLAGSFSIISQKLQIQWGGALTADGSGYAARAGPSAGLSASSGGCAEGGGHGGIGGRLCSSCPSTQIPYGNITAPSTAGSGGYNGAGGAAIKITTSQFALDGTLSSSGAPLNIAGSGAGGSIWIAADTVTGIGSIKANGGVASCGTGSGGVILLDYAINNTFTGIIEAKGGKTSTSLDPFSQGTAGVYSIKSGFAFFTVVDNSDRILSDIPIPLFVTQPQQDMLLQVENADLRITSNVSLYLLQSVTKTGAVHVGSPISITNVTLTITSQVDSCAIKVYADGLLDFPNNSSSSIFVTYREGWYGLEMYLSRPFFTCSN